ncbi:hypothetical protein [Flavilitoribacter nigricans]|uniref:Uncharacterized protein n=1 Tax=Flavilitoribacter nigricans (strain ATCC 23147 / DSM 23189 / NBRC 102662 / NCIMB 1420 / SS-2) TaxID=1122177 RepID=A0A2D0NF85_FLAN2|nr:hypothetical protein [Flavilitoribacter nigricans]PHN07152.1 hypothetical protein CRP01_07965 [Flavilitoribacter nigricans DSM 23189 = NBRC 102662]
MDPKKILRQQFMETVGKQLRDGDPPETAVTLKRLQEEGYSEQQARELISACVAAEMFTVMETNAPFNRQSFVARLKKLPQLPE